jgi:hypothetical protein
MNSDPIDPSDPVRPAPGPLFSLHRQGIALLAQVMAAEGAAVVLPPDESHLNPDGTVGEPWVLELRARVLAYSARHDRSVRFPEIQVRTDGGQIRWRRTRLTHLWIGETAYGATFAAGREPDDLPLFAGGVTGGRRETSCSRERFAAFLRTHRLASPEGPWLEVVLTHFGCEIALRDLRPLIQAAGPE